MALPANIDPSTPAGSDSIALGDDQIRALKQAIIDIFGLPSATNITSALFSSAVDGITQLVFSDSGTSSGTAGHMQRFGRRLFWGTGTTAIAALGRTGLGGVVGNVTGGEDDLATSTLDASTFTASSHSVLHLATGVFASNANVKTLKWKFGATSVTLNPTTTSPNGLGWASLVVVRFSASNAQFAQGIAFIGTLAETYINASPTETQASTIIMKHTGESGSAATNDIVQRLNLVIYM